MFPCLWHQFAGGWQPPSMGAQPLQSAGHRCSPPMTVSLSCSIPALLILMQNPFKYHRMPVRSLIAFTVLIACRSPYPCPHPCACCRALNWPCRGWGLGPVTVGGWSMAGLGPHGALSMPSRPCGGAGDAVPQWTGRHVVAFGHRRMDCGADDSVSWCIMRMGRVGAKPVFPGTMLVRKGVPQRLQASAPSLIPPPSLNPIPIPAPVAAQPQPKLPPSQMV